MLFMFHVCQFLASFALLCVVVPCVFVTFPYYDVSNQVWYLIVSIPYLCLLLYF